MESIRVDVHFALYCLKLQSNEIEIDYVFNIDLKEDLPKVDRDKILFCNVRNVDRIKQLVIQDQGTF